MFLWLCLFVFMAMNRCLCIFQTASLFVSTSLYFSCSESCLGRLWVVGGWLVGRSEEAAAKTTQHDQQGPSSISASTSSSSTSISRSSTSTSSGPPLTLRYTTTTTTTTVPHTSTQNNQATDRLCNTT